MRLIRVALDQALKDVLHGHSEPSRRVCAYDTLVPQHFDQFAPSKRFVM